jgi:hypothetical protein
MKTLRIDGKDYQVEDEVSDFCLLASNRAQELQAALGVDSHDKALGTVAGLKAKAEQAEAAAAELATIRTEQLTAKRLSLLDEATKDGRLTPAKRAELLAAEGTLAWAKDPAALESCLGMLSKPAPSPVEPKAPAPATLTTEEAQVAKQMGLDPKAVQASKQ